jgi:hypothetical protein
MWIFLNVFEKNELTLIILRKQCHLGFGVGYAFNSEIKFVLPTST